MKAALLLAPLLLLGACGTTGTNNFDKAITTLHDDGCHVTANLTAQAGAVNPASGFSATATLNCPGATSPTTAAVGLKAPETAAPAPSLLQ
jgi:hypothetical protein